MSGAFAVLLLLAGFSWLVYKASYLGLDAPDDLKAFIVSPAVALFVAAAWIGYPDQRGRLGGSLIGIGFVALAWITLAPLGYGTWTFYTTYSKLSDSPHGWLKGPHPVATAGATLFPLMGLAILKRRSLFGASLIGAALWFTLCFSASGALNEELGMPRRYSYYYIGQSGGRSINLEPLFPIVLAFLGLTLLLNEKGRPDESPVGPED